jgi:trans-aconitate methyltransferase
MAKDFSDYYKYRTSDIDGHWFSFTQIQFDWIIRKLKSYYTVNDYFTVLDLGCGTGRLLNSIADIFPNAVLCGVDGTPEMLKCARNRLKGRATLIQANLDNYHPSHGYDVIISTTVIHHLENPEGHLLSIKNNLNAHGHGFISEFASDTLRLRLACMWWKLTNVAHKQAWSSQSFKKLLKHNGLNIAGTAILKPDSFWRLQIYDISQSV